MDFSKIQLFYLSYHITLWVGNFSTHNASWDFLWLENECVIMNIDSHGMFLSSKIKQREYRPPKDVFSTYSWVIFRAFYLTSSCRYCVEGSNEYSTFLNLIGSIENLPRNSDDEMILKYLEIFYVNV